jgi:predicted ribonuclease YlaK
MLGAAAMHTGTVTAPEPSLLHNLPIQADELLGREDELATATDAIMQSGYRLLTLLGPGGIGKTRLALGIGCGLADQFNRGAWFVDLTRTRDAAAVDSHILRALGIKADTDSSTLETLIQWLEASGGILVDGRPYSRDMS